MTDIFDDLATFYDIRDMQLVIQRRGGYVLKGQLADETVYVKLSDNKTPFDKEVELLKAFEDSEGLTPHLIMSNTFNNWYVRLIREIPGVTLDKVLPNASGLERDDIISSTGSLLAKFQKQLNPEKIRQMAFWQKNCGSQVDLPLWGDYLKSLLYKWMGRIKFNEHDYKLGLDKAVQSVIHETKQIQEPKTISILHCDFVGRNILISSEMKATGLIDFEAIHIGDPVYDLAKFVWATLDWKEKNEATIVKNSWASTYESSINEDRFNLYVAIQTIAAIAWCDKNTADAIDNIEFRANAIKTLLDIY